jgi:hypothetical protein
VKTLYINLISFPGLILACAAVTGIVEIVSAAVNGIIWLARGMHRHWDRPGVLVTLADGREASILYVARDADAGDMAVVQPYGGEEVESAHQPEWVLCATLAKQGGAR